MTYDLSRLAGETIRLVPYAPDYVARDCLDRLFDHIRDEQALPLLFWGMDSDMLDTMASPDVFAAYMQTKLLLLSVDIATGDQSGCAWFDHVYPGWHAQISVFMRRKWWGKPAREQTALALRYGFEVLGFQRIFAQTPWRHVVRHAEAVGAKVVAEIPAFTVVKDTPAPVYVLCKEKD